MLFSSHHPTQSGLVLTENPEPLVLEDRTRCPKIPMRARPPVLGPGDQATPGGAEPGLGAHSGQRPYGRRLSLPLRASERWVSYPGDIDSGRANDA